MTDERTRYALRQLRHEGFSESDADVLAEACADMGRQLALQLGLTEDEGVQEMAAAMWAVRHGKDPLTVRRDIEGRRGTLPSQRTEGRPSNGMETHGGEAG